jgi:hypothetical protein
MNSSVGRSRRQIAKTLKSKVRGFGKYSIDDVIRMFVCEVVYIDGVRSLTNIFGDITPFPQNTKYSRERLYWEDDILKSIRNKRRRYRRAGRFYETDPVLRYLYDYSHSLRFECGTQYSSRSVTRLSKRTVRRTLHYQSGGIHTVGSHKKETHYITVVAPKWVHVNGEEYMRYHIELLKKAYYNANSKRQQQFIKNQITKYEYILKFKMW